jgi:hypothetical protein
MNYQTIMRSIAAVLLLALLPLQAAGPVIAVYKTPTCGCCGKWVDHLRAAGFTARVTDLRSTAEYRRKQGVPDQLASCHTAVIGDYVVEGHVPAADIRRLLKEEPKARGLAVPGMPMGSPGMEGPRREAYSVLLFHSDGRTSVFRKYPGD